MSKIKIKLVDKIFSDCVRERAGWTCERCGSFKPVGQRMGLHCSHFHGRGNWSTRFDPDNCESLCYGCHQHLGSNPHEHKDRIRRRLGDFAFDLLLERANDTTIGRLARRSEKEIRAHYRAELARMCAARASNPENKIELINWI